MSGDGKGLSRREVLRLLGTGASLLALPVQGAPAPLQRAIPSSGETLPIVGLGTWRTFDVGASGTARQPLRRVLARFAERGARLVDTSPMYGAAEDVLGDLSAGLGLRRALFLATKVWTTGRAAGEAQVRRSLALLRTSTLDLVQVHNLLDVDTHLDTLQRLKADGVVRHVGVTHYVASAYPELERLLRSRRLDFVQMNYSIASREAEARLLPLAAERGAAVIVNRPFEGSGLFERVRGRPLAGWAAEAGCRSWAQVFLKYVLGHPAVTCAIPATASVEHLEDNLDAAAAPLPDAAWRRRAASFVDTL